MEISTSTILVLLAATILLVALVWVMVRSVPRTRGQLRAETLRLDSPSRHTAATLLAGWGSAAGWALALGVAFYVVVRVATEGWARSVIRAANAPYEAANDEHVQGFAACQRLPESSPGATEADVARCYGALGQPPSVPPQANDALPVLLGLLAPVLAVVLVLGVLAVLAARRQGAAVPKAIVLSARLQPRGFASFGPRWALVIPGVTALLLCGWLVATGLASGKDANGRFTKLIVQRNDAAEDPEFGRALPLTPVLQTVDFHGWFFGVPLMAATLAVLVLAVLVLRSLAQAPRNTEPVVLGVDDLARTLKAKFVSGVVGAGLLTVLAQVATHTGGAMLTVAGDVRAVGDKEEFFYHDSMLGGGYAVVAGLLFNVLAILMLVLAFAAVIELAAARKVAVAVALGEESRGNAL